MKERAKQLLIIGDSGVYGWGDRINGGWSEKLKLFWMNQPNAPVIYPLGIRGDGLEKVAKRWQQEWLTRGELRRKVPDAIILSIGLNDTAKIGKINGRPQLSADGFEFGLEQLLTEIKAKTKVMMVGLTPVEESVMPFAECLWYSNKTSKVYESKIEEACLNADIPFLPLLNEMLCEPDLRNWIEPDGIHLNAAGHDWVYQKVIKWSALLNWAELELVTSATPIY